VTFFVNAPYKYCYLLT